MDLTSVTGLLSLNRGKGVVQVLATATAARRTANDEVDDRGLGVAEFRKMNLRALVARYGGPSVLAKKLGYSNGSYISQMIGPKPTRPLTEKACRKWELKLGLPAMWMDQDNDGGRDKTKVVGAREERAIYEAPLDSELLRQVAQAIEDAGIPYAAGKFGDVVTLIYEEAVRLGGKIDEQFLVRVLRLAK